MAEIINVTGFWSYVASGSGTHQVTIPTGYVGAISVDLGDGTNGLNLHGTGVPTTITNQEGGTDLVAMGSNGNSTSSTLANIQNNVSFANSKGFTNVSLYDGGDSTSNRQVVMQDGKLWGLQGAGIISWTPTSSPTGGVNLLAVYGGSGNGNNFLVDNTSNFYYYTLLSTGTGGDTPNPESVTVQATTGTLYLDNPGGHAQVIVGNSSNSLANINGLVNTYGSGWTDLSLYDGGDTTGRTVSMYDGEVAGLAPANIYWTPTSSATGGVVHLAVQGSSGDSTFNVYNTSNFTYWTDLWTGGGGGAGNNSWVNVYATTGTLKVYDPAGYDRTDVGLGSLASINGAVYVSGAGTVALRLDDSSDPTARTVSMYDGEVAGLAPANIYWTATSSATGGVYWLGLLGGTGGNTFNVYNTSNFNLYTVFDIGRGNDALNLYATTGQVDDDNLGSQRTLDVGLGSLANINGWVFVGQIVGAPSGSIALGLDDSGDKNGATLTSSQINAEDGLLTGPGNGGIRYSSAEVTSLTIDGGSGTNSFDVNGTVVPTTLKGGIGKNLFNVAAGLAGALTINGGGINVLAGPNVNNTWAITSTNGGTLDGNVTFSEVQNLTGGTNTDNFVFSNGAGVTGAINGGGGSDTLDYHLYQTGVTVNLLAGTATGTGSVVNVHTVIGSPYNDSITCDNAGDVIYLGGGKDSVAGGTGLDIFVLAAKQLSGTNITGGGGAILFGANTTNTWTITSAGGGTVNGKVTFIGIAQLMGGAANDTFKFKPGGSIPGTIDGGAGTNTLDYSGNGGAAIKVDLADDSAPDILGGAPGGFRNIRGLVGSTATTNTLIGPNGNNAWSINGANAGKVNSFSYKAVQNLVGGSGVDVFALSPAGSETSISGGGAPPGQGDWLDYSAFTTPVIVNLATGSATNIDGLAAGALTGIQDVHGGNGGNTLTGDSQGNILIGGAGANTIIGGSGRSILIADSGPSHIIGGSGGLAVGGDILIGGYTAYDSMTTAHETALMALFAEWQSADSYTTRFKNIDTGAGIPGGSKLNWGTTVKDNLFADTLTAASSGVSTPAVDWFFAGASDTLKNFETGEHLNNT
jgi:hypothetical protein